MYGNDWDCGCWLGCFCSLALEKEVSATLLVTIVVEGIVVFGYSVWRGKPLVPILLTSIIANLITQFLLWIGVNLFYQQYLSFLFIAEILIWVVESLFLYRVPANQLGLQEAFLLSFVANLASFGLGLFLPM
jgi:hypothetical protein